MGWARRIATIVVALVSVTAFGVIGYLLLGFGLLDALYQTITTIATVGFREVHPLTPAGQLFTIVVIVLGVGTVFYSISVIFDSMISGEFRRYLERRRMDSQIARLSGHVIVCGYGRVGRSTTQYLIATGNMVVVIDKEASRMTDLEEVPHLVGDVTSDNVLKAAGIERARALVAALETDADTVYVVLSARALRPDMSIVARARTVDSKDKMVLAGASRAVNPQMIGGRRLAAFALQPDVADFLDVVMHDEDLDFRIQQARIPEGSPLTGHTLGELGLSDRFGAILLAVREFRGGPFIGNPPDDLPIRPGMVLIVFGSLEQVQGFQREARPAPD